MNQPLHRRSLLRILFAALLGGSTAPAAAAPKPAAPSPTPRQPNTESSLLVYSASGLPRGLRIDTNTGCFSRYIGRKP